MGGLERCPPQAPPRYTSVADRGFAVARRRGGSFLGAHICDERLSTQRLSADLLRRATHAKRRPRHQFEGRRVRGGHGGECERVRSVTRDGRFGWATNKIHRCSGKGLPRRRASCVFTPLGVPGGITRSSSWCRSFGCERVAPRDEAAGRVQGRAEAQSRGVVLVVRGDAL